MSEPEIRTSYQSLKAIPEKHWHVLHHMWEDRDLDGAHEAENIIEFLEKETPGGFVGILANDSVYPSCDSWETGHYNCELYDGNWYTVLISKKIWNEYKSKVEAADQKWKDDHKCKVGA